MDLRDKILIIEPTVGYMLKVLKSGKAITKYYDEFKAIRHGNYYDFMTLVDEPIPFILSYNNEKITVEKQPLKNDCDFSALLKSGPSLLIFYKKCFSEYGIIIDKDISDELFGKAVLFELSLRMHANNNSLLNEKERLIDVIDKLSNFKMLSADEKKMLNLGRNFLNKIKHPKKQSPIWINLIKEFDDAYKILVINNLTVL